jgi:menaquinone-dependent protoporphyrinogen oxidase
MTEIGRYTIRIQGRVSESEINRDTPRQMSLVDAQPDATLFAVRTDQSGLVGILRHLHGAGFVLLAVAGEDGPPLAAASPAPAAGSHLSRRAFLAGGCLTVATAGLVAGGMNALAPEPPSVYLPAFTYGEEQMNKQILVAYATYTGSTGEVAATIGETLGARNFAVDVRPMKEDPPLAPYQAVVLGSAVQHGGWLPEALAFVEANRVGLADLPVALFCVHIQNTGDDENSRRRRLAYLDPVRAMVTPVAEGFFAGRFDRRGARLLLPRPLASLVPTMDRRNWEEIRGWADGMGNIC